MKLSETVLHGRACSHSKRIAECSLQVLLTCPRSLKPPHVSPSNSEDSTAPIYTTKQGGIPTASTGKPTNGGCLKYIVNPARHRHSVCTLEEPGLRTGQHLHIAPSTNLVPAPTLHAGLVGGHAFVQRCKPSRIETMEVCGVSPVTSHLGRDRLEPLYYSQDVSVKATPTVQSPIPQGDDMPSPAQLSIILLKLREEVRAHAPVLFLCPSL